MSQKTAVREQPPADRPYDLIDFIRNVREVVSRQNDEYRRADVLWPNPKAQRQWLAAWPDAVMGTADEFRLFHAHTALANYKGSLPTDQVHDCVKAVNDAFTQWSVWRKSFPSSPSAEVLNAYDAEGRVLEGALERALQDLESVCLGEVGPAPEAESPKTVGDTTPDERPVDERTEREHAQDQSAPTSRAAEHDTPARTADEAVARLRDEWATYAQLARVIHKSPSAVRSAINRARQAGELLSQDVEEIRDAGPASPRLRFRIKGIWQHLPTDTERSLTDQST